MVMKVKDTLRVDKIFQTLDRKIINFLGEKLAEKYRGGAAARIIHNSCRRDRSLDEPLRFPKSGLLILDFERKRLQLEPKQLSPTRVNLT